MTSTEQDAADYSQGLADGDTGRLSKIPNTGAYMEGYTKGREIRDQRLGIDRGHGVSDTFADAQKQYLKQHPNMSKGRTGTMTEKKLTIREIFEELTIREIFEIACDGEDNPTAVAGQIYAEIASLQFSEQAIEECERMARAAITAAGSYSKAIGFAQMTLIGLSNLAVQGVRETLSSDDSQHLTE